MENLMDDVELVSQEDQEQRKQKAYKEVDEFVLKVKAVFSGDEQIPSNDIKEIERFLQEVVKEEVPGPYHYMPIKTLQHSDADVELEYYIETVGIPVLDGGNHWLVSVDEDEEGPCVAPLETSSCATECIPFGRCIVAFGHPYFDSEVERFGLQMVFFRELQREHLATYHKNRDLRSRAFIPEQSQ